MYQVTTPLRDRRCNLWVKPTAFVSESIRSRLCTDGRDRDMFTWTFESHSRTNWGA